MARHWKIVIAILAAFAVVGLFTLPGLLRNVFRLRRANATAAQARREVIQPSISTPTDTRVKAQLFWISTSDPSSLEPTTIELPLSADAVLRARQLIEALIAQPPSATQRTLPADATLAQFYILPDGSGVADFSEGLGTETPSGILSEQLAVDSIARTLGANLTTVSRLKILIQGQEAETLAGHLDLSGFFPVEQASSDSAPAVPSDGSSGTLAVAPVDSAATANSAGSAKGTAAAVPTTSPASPPLPVPNSGGAVQSPTPSHAIAPATPPVPAAAKTQPQAQPQLH